MKLKVSLSGESIKSFLFEHVEKIVLTCVILLSAALVVKGYQRETTDVTPQSMVQLANQAKQNIEQTEWEDVAEERIQQFDFKKRAERVQQPISLALYEIGPLRQFLQKPEIKRLDPQLLAIVELEVKGGFAPMAIRMDQDEIDNQEEEGERFRGGNFPGRLGGFDEDRNEPRERQLTSEERKRFEGGQQGRNSRGGGFSVGGGLGVGGGFAGGGSNTKAVGTAFVALRGLVPVRKQLAIYENCFDQSDLSNQGRDLPNYIYYKLQRRMLRADGKPGDWEVIPTNRSTLFINEWAGVTSEIADSKFLVQNQQMGPKMGGALMGGTNSGRYGGQWIGLVWPLPPLLLHDITPFALHSKVPRQPVESRGLGVPGGMRGDMADEPEINPEDVQEEEALTNRGLGQGRTSNFRAGRGGLRSAGPMDGGFGIGGMRGAGIRALPEYYLFRFFDFQVEQGKKYQYQVKLYLDDPNNPANRDVAPSNRILAADVIDRIQKLRDADTKEGKRRGTFHRETEWSEASSWAHVPDGHNIFLGVPSKVATISVGDFEFSRKRPEMEVMAVVWDSEKAWEVTATCKVKRGTIINFLGENIKAVDPAGSRVIPLKEHNISTNAIVADLRGGKELPGKKSELLEPGELLLFDAYGNFSVRNELDDYPLYAKYELEDQESDRSLGRPDPGIGFGEGFPNSRRGRGAKSNQPNNRRRKK